MKFLSKTALFTAAAATAIAATPANARDRHYGRDGIDAGDVIAGALVIGGIAAIASAASNDRGRYNDRYNDRYDDRYNDRNYDNGGYGYYNNGYSSRTAVEQCVRAAERDASRYGRARITDVTRIDRVRGGYEVRGRLVVAGSRWNRYGRGYDGWDRYGNNYDRYGNDYDKGKFSCVTRYGGIQDVRVTGLRG